MEQVQRRATKLVEGFKKFDYDRIREKLSGTKMNDLVLWSESYVRSLSTIVSHSPFNVSEVGIR